MRRFSRQLLVLFAVIVALALAGCDGGNVVVQGNSASVNFVLTSSGTAAAVAEHNDDRPRLQNAYVTFSGIVARNLNGELIDVTIDLPVTVDLLAVERDGRNVALPEGFLPPGTYDQIIVVMSEAELVRTDGTVITITPPGGGWTKIVQVCPFEVVDGAATTVTIKFRGFRSFKWDGQRYHFDPDFECGDGNGGDDS